MARKSLSNRQKDLREKSNISVLVGFTKNICFPYSYLIDLDIHTAHTRRISSFPITYSSYEEALKKGLDRVKEIRFKVKPEKNKI